MTQGGDDGGQGGEDQGPSQAQQALQVLAHQVYAVLSAFCPEVEDERRQHIAVKIAQTTPQLSQFVAEYQNAQAPWLRVEIKKRSDILLSKQAADSRHIDVPRRIQDCNGDIDQIAQWCAVYGLIQTPSMRAVLFAQGFDVTIGQLSPPGQEPSKH